jgi:tRNA(Arg) A34 adenosine deaminase TadA
MKHPKLLATCYDKRGKVLSVGENSYTCTSPIQAKYARLAGMPEKIYLHAEVLAIIRARGKKIHHIHVERFNRKGEPMEASPCPICMLAIKEAGIKLITHTVSRSVIKDS